MSLSDRMKVLEIAKKACKTLDQEIDFKGTFYELEELSKDSEELAEFGPQSEDKFEMATQANDDWPKGRGLFINIDRTFQIKVNTATSHIQIKYVKSQSEVPDFLIRFIEIYQRIEETISFAYDDVFGYTLADPLKNNYCDFKIYSAVNSVIFDEKKQTKEFKEKIER